MKNRAVGVTPKQLEYLARTIVNRLEDRGLVEFGDAEIGIGVVTSVLQENFRTFEQISAESHERFMKAHGRAPSETELLEEMRQLAAARQFTI